MKPDLVALGWESCRLRAKGIADIIKSSYKNQVKLFGVPRGGIHAAQLVDGCLPEALLVENPSHCSHIIDDIIDTGKTQDSFQIYGKPFFALVDKPEEGKQGVWYEFPWERMKHETGVEDNIIRIIEFLGDDPNREGLKETPRRVAASFAEIYSGYGKKVEDVVKTFEDGVCDEMVICRGVEFFSTCEHHMLPFFGTAHIAYIPGKKIIGLSKLARILEIYSRRLQVQEKLTEQVTKAIVEAVDPKGAACVLTAKHFCCTARGINKQGSEMVTSSLLGVFRQPEVRQEFFKLIEL